MHALTKGSYSASASGYTSIFSIGDVKYEATFSKGVRGINIPDTITITDNNIFSSKLGAYTSFKVFKET